MNWLPWIATAFSCVSLVASYVVRRSYRTLRRTERARRKRGGRTVARKIAFLRIALNSATCKWAKERQRRANLEREVRDLKSSLASVRSLIEQVTSYRVEMSAPDTYDVRMIIQRPGDQAGVWTADHREVVANDVPPDVVIEALSQEVARAIRAGVRMQSRTLNLARGRQL